MLPRHLTCYAMAPGMASQWLYVFCHLSFAPWEGPQTPCLWSPPSSSHASLLPSPASCVLWLWLLCGCLRPASCFRGGFPWAERVPTKPARVCSVSSSPQDLLLKFRRRNQIHPKKLARPGPTLLNTKPGTGLERCQRAGTLETYSQPPRTSDSHRPPSRAA